VVANGRLKAAFVAEIPGKGKAIIDITDKQHAYFIDLEGERRLKLKGRVTEEVARQAGFNGGYRVVSLVEMDFCGDELAFLNEVLFDEKKTKKAPKVVNIKF
jgi:hypothetical protein